MTEKIFNLDVKNIVNDDPSTWQKDFFWPVRSPDLYNNILKRLDEKYRGIIKSQKAKEIREILVIRYKLIFDYAMFLHSLKIVQDIKSLGFSFGAVSDKDYFYYAINNSFPPEGFQTTWHHLKMDFLLREKINGYIQSFKNFLKYNFPNKMIDLRSNGNIPVLFQPNAFTKEFVLKNVKHKIYTINHFDLMSGTKVKISGNLAQNCKEVSEEVSTAVNEIAIENDILLSNKVREFIWGFSYKILNHSLADLFSVKESFPVKKPVDLYTGTPGSYMRRLVSSALNMKNDGSKVFSFAHGEFTGHDESSNYIAINLGTVNALGVFGKNSIPLVKKVKEKFSEYVRDDVDIFSIETDFFKKISAKFKNTKLPAQIKKVMLIGMSYSKYSCWVTKDLPSQFVLLDFECRIIKFLKEQGFDVIYKAHPETGVRFNFLENWVNVCYESFESVMDIPDAFVFFRPMSTTFYEAFCTRKPIIYLHYLRRDWGEDFSLIMKRCRIVKTDIDDRNRFIFDEQEFLEKIKQKPNEPDMSFMEKYLFPQLSI